MFKQICKISFCYLFCAISILTIFCISSLYASFGQVEISTITTDTTQLYIDADPSKNVKIGDNYIFVNGTTGNIGIGTTNATRKLQVAGDITSNTTVQAAVGNFTNLYTANPLSVSLNSLSDVNVSNPASNQSLSYNELTEKWENAYVNVGGAGAVYISKVKAFETMPQLAPIYIKDWDITQNCPIIGIADSDDQIKMPCVGITNKALTVGTTSADAVVVEGIISNCNTNGYTIGNILWVTSSGGLTNVRPTGSGIVLQKVGQVIRVDASAGLIEVFGSGMSMKTSYLSALDGSPLRALETDTSGNLSALGILKISEINAIDNNGLKLYDEGSNSGIFIQNMGNVGINTTDPTEVLDVNGYIKTSSGLKLPDGTILISTSTILKDTQVGYMPLNNVPRWDGTQLSTGTIFDKSGNIGIGITNPLNKLSVAGMIQSTSGGFKCPDGTILASTAPFNCTEIDPQVGTMPTNNVPRWDGTALSTGTMSDINGNIGIGITNPVEKLEINGAIKFSGSAAGSEKGTMYYDSGSNKIVYRNTYTWVSLDGGGVSYSGTLWSENGANVYRGGGNVGIGTSDPLEMLHVTENILADGKIISDKVDVSTITAKDGSGLFFDANNDGTPDVIFYPDGTISHAGGPGTIKASASDAVRGYLIDKVTSTVNGGISIGKINPGGNEKADINLDINGMNDISAMADYSDYLPLYDTSASSQKKVTKRELISDEPLHISGTQTITTPGKYFVTTDGSNTTITIPDAAAGNEGSIFTLVKEDDGIGKLIVKTTSNQTIVNQSSQTISVQGQGIKLIADWNASVGSYLKVADSRFLYGLGLADGAMQYWDAGNLSWKSTEANVRYLNNALTIGDGTFKDNIIMYIDTAGGVTANAPRLEYRTNYFGYRGLLYKNPVEASKALFVIEAQDEAAETVCMVNGPNAHNYESKFNLYSYQSGQLRGWELGKGTGSNPPFNFKAQGSTLALQLQFNGDVYMPNNVGIGTTNPTSRLQVNGSFGNKTTAISSNYTAGDETVILANAAGGAITVTLPLLSAAQNRVYYIKKTDSSTNKVTIDPNGSETIDGLTTIALGIENSCYEIVASSSQWNLIGDYDVFGKEFQYIESAALSTNATTTWAEKTSLSVSVPQGIYRVGWSYAWYHASASNNFLARIQLDNTTTIMSHVEEPKDAATTQAHYTSGFAYINI
ncbi:MAG: hypothetical protein ABH857_00660 [Elusimicrobiota bacterium]